MQISVPEFIKTLKKINIETNKFLEMTHRTIDDFDSSDVKKLKGARKQDFNLYAIYYEDQGCVGAYFVLPDKAAEMEEDDNIQFTPGLDLIKALAH